MILQSVGQRYNSRHNNLTKSENCIHYLQTSTYLSNFTCQVFPFLPYLSNLVLFFSIACFLWSHRIAESFGGTISAKTVLLNPTATDSLSGTRALRLALEYAEDLYAGKPLANYIWFTKSPKVNQIPRMLNPENKGWLERINLYDFREPAAT